MQHELRHELQHRRQQGVLHILFGYAPFSPQYIEVQHTGLQAC